MARTSIPIQTIPFQGGAEISYTAADAANGMMFDNDGRTTLRVKNGGAGSINVTVVAVPDEAGRAVNLVQSVNAGADAEIGPLRPAWWNQRSTDIGKVYVDFSSGSSVTVAALRFKL